MPGWSPEADREMLLAVVIATDAKPPKEIWQQVSDRLGGVYNANGIKYYWPCSFIFDDSSMNILTNSFVAIVNDSTS